MHAVGLLDRLQNSGGTEIGTKNRPAKQEGSHSSDGTDAGKRLLEAKKLLKEEIITQKRV